MCLICQDELLEKRSLLRIVGKDKISSLELVWHTARVLACMEESRRGIFVLNAKMNSSPGEKGACCLL